MTKRFVFYSFHYDPDNWRASQVRNMGVVEGNQQARDNDWEQIKRGGDTAIKRWIDSQLNGKSCTIVLIGSQTAKRKWIDYEIENTWNSGKGVLGIHVHNLKDRFLHHSSKGSNPFAHFTVGNMPLSSVVNTYDPPFWDSQQVYRHINSHIGSWIEDAIKIRQNHG